MAVALNLKGQTVANEINDKMLQLTSEAFEDNATVRVVTLVTLIYLPASFVSVSHTIFMHISVLTTRADSSRNESI